MRLVSISRLVFFGMTCFASEAYSQDRMQYPYVTPDGQVARTEEAQATPEPYRSAYAMLRLQASRGPARGTDVSGNNSDEASRVERQRAQWQARLVQARTLLLQTLTALVAADDALGQAKQNPLLAVTPQGRAKVNRAQALYGAALSNVRAAESNLMSKLPTEAREAQVPPLWLEP